MFVFLTPDRGLQGRGPVPGPPWVSGGPGYTRRGPLTHVVSGIPSLTPSVFGCGLSVYNKDTSLLWQLRRDIRGRPAPRAGQIAPRGAGPFYTIHSTSVYNIFSDCFSRQNSGPRCMPTGKRTRNKRPTTSINVGKQYSMCRRTVPYGKHPELCMGQFRATSPGGPGERRRGCRAVGCVTLTSNTCAIFCLESLRTLFVNFQ